MAEEKTGAGGMRGQGWAPGADGAQKRVALITGGSQGIGRAMAVEFGKAGYAVAICARTAADVEKAAAEISGMGIDCAGFALDVSNPAAVKAEVAKIAKKYGRIDALVNCAGIYGPIGPLEENSEAEWESAIRINLCGTAYCVRAVLPIMKRQKSGCIITMAGAGVGGKNIKPNFSSYTTSKFAICGFTEAISRECEGSGVRINAISPGAVNTRLLSQVLSAGSKAGKFYDESLKQKEQGGTPPEAAAKLALFLAGKEGAHLSGKTLSAVWDKPERLSVLDEKAGKSLYTLRRIDNELFCEGKR